MFDYQRAKKTTLQRQLQAADMPKEATLPTVNQLMAETLESGAAAPPSSSEGTPLDDAMRVKYEQRFGLPMGDVRIHHDSREPAKYGADAFACDSDIFLQAGKEDLLSHEVTHVAQQKKGLVHPTEQIGGIPVSTSPQLERAADAERLPPGPSEAAQRGPVIQLHPSVKIGRQMQEVNTPDKFWEILRSEKCDYSHLPESCLEDAISVFLKTNEFYLSSKHMAQDFEAKISEILKSPKYIDWLTSEDPFIQSNYSKRPEHVDALARHEARRLAPIPERRDKNGLITLYHGGPSNLDAILPAQPSFRNPSREDPSRDGFVSVASTISGATPYPQGQIYRIKLTEDEFRRFKFRQFTGSSELRTRYALPIHSTVKQKKK